MSNDIPVDEQGRPAEFQMKIHSGMLETMGHNMYSSVAKCLAEFVANAYDADAKEVSISMDFSAIESAKKSVRAAAREQKSKGLRSDASAIYDPLPEAVTISIHDDGHGMSPQEIQNYFMAITRNRREDQDGKQTKIMTESGLRRVMGRKGVGKLAGFGAAEHLKIISKREDQEYETEFEMDYSNFRSNQDLTKPRFKAVYRPAKRGEKYTKIILSKLRCDSLKPSEHTISSTLAKTFSILDQDFTIFLNEKPVKDLEIDWEFTFPEGASESKMGDGNAMIDGDPDDTIPFKYLIRFRARPDDHGATPEQKSVRGSLPADRRGARIYSHGRLTHGPSLLGLHSGIHNFHAQDYMECIVIADAIDEYENDFIVTSREGLHGDNPVVDALFKEVTSLMKSALAAHYKFRDAEITQAIDQDAFTKQTMSALQFVNKKSQKAAKDILKTVAREHGINSPTYIEMAPILLQAVNAGDVLSKLIELETDPKSLPVLTHSMAELAQIETSDLLKLYRGRSKAINGLEKLYRDSLSIRKGKGYENELHSLFKEFPWLIRPEFGTYLTSDKPMGDVCRTLNSTLCIDQELPKHELEKSELDEDHTRPDLVFVATRGATPEEIIVVELKSPGINLNLAHLDQLQEYMFKIEEYAVAKFHKNIRVNGYLIGTKPPLDTSSTSGRRLLSEMSKMTPNSNFRVYDIVELLTHAREIHNSGIELLESEEEYQEDFLS